ncbi:MAG: hypothetical protein A2046_07200 [Bacteroidetes bacterium GWA2_30_7]|nr:MAG: hypothetical protein A2046_07200 [Bacteroidetes bacterium GWA2_30_7]
MKTLLLSLTLLFSFTFAFAQDDSSSKKAKEILDKVSAKMKTYTTVQAEFVSTMENLQDNIKETLKGTIRLKGNKYKLEISGTEIFTDGKTMWTYLKDANEVNISEPDPNDDSSLNPAKIFKIWESDFKFKFVKETFEKAIALYEIDLYPINKDKTYSRITLKIDKDKLTIASIKYVGKEGNNYTIEIQKFIPNNPFADNLFTFDEKAHPGVEKIDMR